MPLLIQLNHSGLEEKKIYLLHIDVDEHVTKQIVLFAMNARKIRKRMLIDGAVNIRGDKMN